VSSGRGGTAVRTRARAAELTARAVRSGPALRGPQLWEEDDVPDRGNVEEDHQESIDPDPDAPGGGHSMLQGADELLVERMGLVLPSRLGLGLGLEPGPLLVGIGELRERGRQLDAGHHEVEVLGEPRVLPMGPGEGRDLLGKVADEGRIEQRLLDELLEHLLHELPRAPRWVYPNAVALGQAGQVRTFQGDLLAHRFGHAAQDGDPLTARAHSTRSSSASRIIEW